jgi:hypothetical protein
MAITSNFYSSIDTYLSIDDLPEELGFIKEGLENVLGSIFIKEIQFVKSPAGNQGTYIAVLKIYQSLSADVPGTGITFTLCWRSQSVT